MIQYILCILIYTHIHIHVINSKLIVLNLEKIIKLIK